MGVVPNPKKIVAEFLDFRKKRNVMFWIRNDPKRRWVVLILSWGSEDGESARMDGGYSGKQWLPTGEGGNFLCLVLSPSSPILQALGHIADANINFNFLITILKFWFWESLCILICSTC